MKKRWLAGRMTHQYKKLPVTMKMWMQFNVMPWTHSTYREVILSHIYYRFSDKLYMTVYIYGLFVSRSLVLDRFNSSDLWRDVVTRHKGHIQEAVGYITNARTSVRGSLEVKYIYKQQIRSNKSTNNYLVNVCSESYHHIYIVQPTWSRPNHFIAYCY